MSEYEQRVEQFLQSADPPIKFVVQLLGDACPRFCEDRGKPGIGEFPRRTHVHGQHWGFMFYRQGKDNLSSEFWDSYQNSLRRWLAKNWGPHTPRWLELQAGAPKHHTSLMFPPKGWRDLKPSAYDVLSCLTQYEPGQFDDWCSDFGCDTDSRKAEQIYHACCEEWRQVRAFFTEAELGKLREIAQ